jgi:hypothetical protein
MQGAACWGVYLRELCFVVLERVVVHGEPMVRVLFLARFFVEVGEVLVQGPRSQNMLAGAR